MVYMCTKFLENFLNGFQVKERTRFDRVTDGRTDRQLWGKQYFFLLSGVGEDIMKYEPSYQRSYIIPIGSVSFESKSRSLGLLIHDSKSLKEKAQLQIAGR